jgi:hypothetical protein
VTTYADLITAKDAETLRDELLARLTDADFPVTAWQTGNAARTLVAVDVQTLAELYALVVQIGKGWSLDDAAGAWLTLHAWSRYRVERILATFARHTVTLTAASGAGPYSITAGQLVVTNALGIRFRSTNTSTEVVAYGTPLTLTVEAQTAGTKGNTAPSAVVTPALAGVTFAWTARTVTAVDEELDAPLRQRCRDKWATLAPAGATQATYRYWLTNAVDGDDEPCGITRVAFATPPGDGTVPVWVAGASGQIGGAQLTAAQAYVEERRPHTDTPDIDHATEVNVDVSGMTVRFKPGKNTADNRTAVKAAIVAHIDGLDISTADDPVIVDEAGVKAAAYSGAPGLVRDVDWSTADATLGAGEVAVCTGENSITFSE